MTRSSIRSSARSLPIRARRWHTGGAELTETTGRWVATWLARAVAGTRCPPRTQGRPVERRPQRHRATQSDTERRGNAPHTGSRTSAASPTDRPRDGRPSNRLSPDRDGWAIQAMRVRKQRRPRANIVNAHEYWRAKWPCGMGVPPRACKLPPSCCARKARRMPWMQRMPVGHRRGLWRRRHTILWRTRRLQRVGTGRRTAQQHKEIQRLMRWRCTPAPMQKMAAKQLSSPATSALFSEYSLQRSPEPCRRSSSSDKNFRIAPAQPRRCRLRQPVLLSVRSRFVLCARGRGNLIHGTRTEVPAQRERQRETHRERQRERQREKPRYQYRLQGVEGCEI